ENTLLPNTQKIVTGLSSGIWSAITMLKNLVIGLIVMVYLLNMKRTLLGQTRKLVYAFFPSGWANEILAEARLVDKMFGGFITGKLLDSAIIGILCYIVLYFMKMPYTLLISIIVGIT
ncbi:MAG TPA: AI-2E family transporter, partial [Oribacterium sp.]|nr:AI-2E family transporter [Oribacterium sp.]